jgi:hypothetical protein
LSSGDPILLTIIFLNSNKKLSNMGKIKLFTFFSLFFISLSIAKADSPLTSTSIWESYKDIDIIVKAQKKGKMTLEFAKFLHDADNSIDEKAALINAIGWSIDGKNNTELYAKYIFDKKLTELNLPEISGEDLFYLGYLQALDDYFNPAKSLPYFEEAEKKINTSLTVSLIHTLAKAQNIMNGGDWCQIWNMTYQTLNDKSLYRDLRESAIKIIRDYMILYKC